MRIRKIGEVSYPLGPVLLYEIDGWMDGRLYLTAPWYRRRGEGGAETSALEGRGEENRSALFIFCFYFRLLALCFSSFTPPHLVHYLLAVYPYLLPLKDFLVC
jgi:hypothetical protein